MTETEIQETGHAVASYASQQADTETAVRVCKQLCGILAAAQTSNATVMVALAAAVASFTLQSNVASVDDAYVTLVAIARMARVGVNSTVTRSAGEVLQ